MVRIEFEGIVKETKVKTLASNDKGYTVILQGEDSRMLECGTLPGDAMVKVTITLPNENQGQ